MNYVRDYCKVIAFDVFKVRVNLISNDFYFTSKEMLEELYSIFGEYDKLIKYNVKLYNLAFAIRIGFKKKNKIFDIFYIRFLVIIVLLNYNKIYKISILKYFIILRFRF